MIEWGGWQFDELRDELVLPTRIKFTPTEARAFGTLVIARGFFVPKEDLLERCRSKNVMSLYALIGAIVAKLRLEALPGIEVKINVGYALNDARGYDPRERDVAAILIKELEATGPHAKVVASMIGKLYKNKELK